MCEYVCVSVVCVYVACMCLCDVCICVYMYLCLYGVCVWYVCVCVMCVYVSVSVWYGVCVCVVCIYLCGVCICVYLYLCAVYMSHYVSHSGTEQDSRLLENNSFSAFCLRSSEVDYVRLHQSLRPFCSP